MDSHPTLEDIIKFVVREVAADWKQVAIEGHCPKFLGHEEERGYSGQTGVSSVSTTDGKQLSSVTLLPYRVEEELSQYSLCMHKCTCTVICCRVPFVCLLHVNVFLGLLSVFIARACRLPIV